MLRQTALLALLSLVTVAAINLPAQEVGAASKERYVTRDFRTLVYVDGIHCQFCANKLAKSLKTVKGIKKIEVDLKKKLAVLIPHDARKLPTPLAQWEAVEKAGYKPVKLMGPRGTWVSKPKARTAATAT